jgi:hypothetical protein
VCSRRQTDEIAADDRQTTKLAVKALLEVASVDDSGKNIEVAVMRAGWAQHILASVWLLLFVPGRSHYAAQYSSVWSGQLTRCFLLVRLVPANGPRRQPLTMVSDAELDEFVKEIEAEKEEAGKYIANATCRSASRASAAHLRFDRDVDWFADRTLRGLVHAESSTRPA